MRFEFKATVLVLGCLCGMSVANAQPAPVAAAPADARVGAKTANTIDTRYRIGPGDVLEVRVARAPELSRDAVRVDQSGNIRMPMLDNDIPAACLTEAELAQNIAKQYLKYKREPHVDVFVKEFQSQPAAVIGAVRNPAQFKLQRQVQLLELISLVGGPTELAGQTIQIVHGASGLSCEQSATASITESGAFATYRLEDTLRGVPDANPVVHPGDIISVPQADQVFVVGNVIKPTAIPLKEPLTVSKAIAMAGGTAPNTKRGSVRIVRQVTGANQKQEIRVDLTAIEKNRAPDVELVANDVIDVPVSGTKRLLQSLIGSVVPSAAQLPVRVIP
jgi:polysaccharide biosynthesis/export protein